MKHQRRPIVFAAACLAATAATVATGCDEQEYDGAPGSVYEGLDAPLNAELATAVNEATEKKSWATPPEMMLEEGKDYTAVIKTNMGDITLDLFEADAPLTVNNFVFLASEDFYDGVIFHRVIDNFMIQGGDPDGTGTGGPGYQFEDEVENNPNTHEPFTLSMANAGPNTNGSQFFITDSATPHLNGKHTVFGRVSEGKDVVEKISAVPTVQRDRPLKTVVMQDVVILIDGEPMNGAAEGSEQAAPSTRPAE